MLTPCTSRLNRTGKLSECRGDSKRAWGFGGEFVVAAAEILYEGESCDDDSSGVFSAQPAHGSQSVFQPAVVGFESASTWTGPAWCR